MQLLQEVDRGEWWILPDGSAVFADGDVGDSNHEGHVIETLSREIYEHFLGEVYDDIGLLSDYEDSLLHALIANPMRIDHQVYVVHFLYVPANSSHRNESLELPL